MINLTHALVAGLIEAGFENMTFSKTMITCDEPYNSKKCDALFELTYNLGFSNGAGGYAGNYYKQIKNLDLYKYNETNLIKLLNMI